MHMTVHSHGPFAIDYRRIYTGWPEYRQMPQDFLNLLGIEGTAGVYIKLEETLATFRFQDGGFRLLPEMKRNMRCLYGHNCSKSLVVEWQGNIIYMRMIEGFHIYIGNDAMN